MNFDCRCHRAGQWRHAGSQLPWAGFTPRESSRTAQSVPAVSAGGELPWGQPYARPRGAGSGDQLGPGPSLANAGHFPHAYEGRAECVDCLVKQLSGAEAVPPEPALLGVACCPEEVAVEEPALHSPPAEAGWEVTAVAGEERERPSFPSASGEAPVRLACLAGPPFSVGSKPIRRKTSNKIMATSGGTGRSPLSILQDDNSPSALVPRQGKRHALGENLGERKEVTVDLSRSLKSGSCTWSDLNKENQQCPFVEN
nr:cell division cycle-associated protein 3 isoform X2 [Dromaius novaehollandiae]